MYKFSFWFSGIYQDSWCNILLRTFNFVIIVNKLFFLRKYKNVPILWNFPWDFKRDIFFTSYCIYLYIVFYLIVYTIFFFYLTLSKDVFFQSVWQDCILIKLYFFYIINIFYLKKTLQYGLDLALKNVVYRKTT